MSDQMQIFIEMLYIGRSRLPREQKNNIQVCNIALYHPMILCAHMFFFALPPLTKNKMWKQSSIKCCSTPADSMFRLITFYVRLLCFYNLSRAKSMGKNVHSVCVREIAFSARKLFAKPIERSRKFVEKCTVH